jgi:DNA-binding MarR family transcriptional regulator
MCRRRRPALDELGPASQAEFSRRTAIDRSDMVAIINELTEQGYVERSADSSDGRRNVITITPAGRGSSASSTAS